MQAVILAAGTGSRLGANMPKCLVRIGGQTLLEQQLDSLGRVGVTSVLVVVGFRGELIRQRFGPMTTFATNHHYADTNSLYSFLQARSWVTGEVPILNADVLAHPAVLQALVEGPPNAVAYDSGSGHDPEHMKVELHGRCLVRMSKDLPAMRIHGENVGMLRLSRDASRDAFAAAKRMVSNGHRQGWLATAVNHVAKTHAVSTVDVAGLPWTEIDFPEDLRDARRAVWPAIVADVARWPNAVPRARMCSRPLPSRNGGGRSPEPAVSHSPEEEPQSSRHPD